MTRVSDPGVYYPDPDPTIDKKKPDPDHVNQYN